MTRRFSILIAAILAVVLSACSISNEVHFNKDYSGDYKMTVDMSEIIEMAKSFDPSMAESDEDPFSTMINEEDRARIDSVFNSVEGVSSPSFNLSDDFVATLSFDFDDIDALNRLFATWSEGAAAAGAEMGNMGMGGLGTLGAPTFTREGKTVIHSAEMPEMDGMEVEGMEGMDMAGMMEGFAGMMDYQVIMTFDKKIKSVGGEGFDILSQEKKSVKTRVDMQSFLNGGAYKIAVQTK